MRSNSAVPRHRRIKKVLKRAKGFHLGNKRHVAAQEIITRAENYATVHRRNKKREIKRLWILRINAAARSGGMKYSTFVNGLKKAGVNLNSKALAQIAYDDGAAFNKLIEKSKLALA